MICTIKLSQEVNSKDLNNFLLFLEGKYVVKSYTRKEYNKSFRHKTVKCYSCITEYFTISIDGHFIYLEGSLWNYYKGHNAGDFTSEEIINALQKLSFDYPHINWYRAKVIKLHIGPNIVVSKSPDLYLNMITGGKNFRSYIIKSNNDVGLSHYINNKSHGFAIYNKTADYKRKYKECLDNAISSQNILRIEYRMDKYAKIKNKTGIVCFTVADMLSNINLLYSIWYEMYLSLDKDYSPEIQLITSKEELQLISIQRLGINESKKIIEASYKAGSLRKSTRYNLMRYIKNLQIIGKQHASDDGLMPELDKLVNNYMNSHNK